MEEIYISGTHVSRKQSPDIERKVAIRWCDLFSMLMTVKGLYQNLSIDSATFDGFADSKYSSSGLQAEFSSRPIIPCSRGEGDDRVIRGKTGPLGLPPLGTSVDEMPLSFHLPNILLECKNCRSDSSFLSMSCSANTYGTPYPIPGDSAEQVFNLYYRCATCRKQFLVFQVLRRGLRAQLTGRSQPFRPKLDKIWPEWIFEIVQNALSADAENDVPAAYYHLRTAIEFHAKHELSIPLTDKCDGGELCEKYGSTLNARIRSDFPSVAKLYSELSAGLHSRVVDSSEFHSLFNKFADHLRAKELFSKYPAT